MNLVQQNEKILVVDDDISQRLVLRSHLQDEGYKVLEAEDGFEALTKLNSHNDIRIVLTDLIMPEMDGFELITNIRNAEVRYTYIIVLTSMDDRTSLINALSLGADDYLMKPIAWDEIRLRLQGARRLLKLESQEELTFSMAKLAEARSEETGFHLERVYFYSRILARDYAIHYPELGMNLSVAEEIAKVTPLHDIGKVAIPDHILHKPGPLSKEECETMKTHTVIGGNLLEDIYRKTGAPYLWFAYEIAMHHHERWNGGGYPDGLTGEDIPLSARIMALADIYDALTSERCYKKAFSHAKARDLIINEKGKHLDPRSVESFLRNQDEWLAVKQRYKD